MDCTIKTMRLARLKRLCRFIQVKDLHTYRLCEGLKTQKKIISKRKGIKFIGTQARFCVLDKSNYPTSNKLILCQL